MGSVNLNAQVTSIIPAGTPAPLNLAAPSQVRASSSFPSGLKNAIATDLDNIARTVNSLHSAAQVQPKVSQILLTNAQGQVIAAFGNMTYQGVRYVNFLSELHVGDFTLSGDPTLAVFNANVDGLISIGNNGWIDVHDPFSGNAAWIGTQNDTVVITGAADNGSGLIRLTATLHGLPTGTQATVRNMNLAGVPNANGTWTISTPDATHVDLQASVFAGVFSSVPAPPGINTAQPTIDRVLAITGASDNGSGLIRITTAFNHGYLNADQVNIPSPGPGGVPNAVGQWVITVIDNQHFDLRSSTFAGVYTSGGTALRYFAGLLAETLAIGASFTNFGLRAFADGSLLINNATITLQSANGTIILDPSVPSIKLYDGGGAANVSIEIIQDSPLSVTATTNASPDVVTVPGHTYVNGDTVHIVGSTGDTAINGYRIVESSNTGAGTFKLTDFSGNPINGNGAYTGGGQCTRYYAGMLTDTIAIGASFTNYKLRAFADGTLIINGAVIVNAQINSITSVGGTAPNTVTLTINNGTLTIVGAGTAAGTGNITIDGELDTATVVASTSVKAASYKSGATTGQSFSESVLTGSGTGIFLVSISVTTSTLSYTPGVSTLTVVVGVSSASGVAVSSLSSTSGTYTAGLRTA